MTRFLNFCAAHAWPVLAVLLAISALAATVLPDLRVRISSQELLVRDDPDRRYYEEMKKSFRDEQTVLLVLQDPLPLAPAKLAKLKPIIAALEKLPFVSRVQSLFSVPYLKTVDGFMDKRPYLDPLPKTDQAAAKVLAAALTNPFLKNTLLSADGRVMSVAIALKPADPRFGDELITKTITDTTRPLAGVYSQVFAIGFPYVRAEIAQRIVSEQTRLVPIALVILIVVLFLLLRQLIDVLVPVMTSALSILWVLAFMTMLDIPLNVVTSIVPILLIIVGSSEDVHLLSEFRLGQSQGLDTRKALGFMARKLGRTIFFAFFTTFVGFLSVGLSGIEVLRQFALVAAAGLYFNFIITSALIPALMAIAGGWRLDGGAVHWLHGNKAVTQRYWTWLRTHRQPVSYITLVLAAIALTGIPRIQINHNVVDSLGQKSQVRERLAVVNSRLSGLETLSIVVDSGIRDTFLKVHYLEQLAKIQAFVQSQGYARSTTSFADHLSLLNAAFDELDEPAMPESDAVVNELMLFLGYRHVRDYVSPDYSRARVLVRHDVTDNARLRQFIGALKQFLATEIDSGLRARVTGDSVLSLDATDAMIRGQLQSIALLLVIIVIIVSVLFTDVRVGLIALAPNLFPVIILFGAMGYAGFPLNIGTTMAAAIAIGIAVDGTLHFMLRYNNELKSERSQSRAMHMTICAETRPMFASSMALVAGFLVFTLSDFPPVAQFGVLSAIVMSTALVADFIITPLGIAAVRLITLWDLLSVAVKQDVLRNSHLFAGMRRFEIRRFIASSTIFDLPPGHAVFRIGEDSNEIYLVLAGHIEVRFSELREHAEVVECIGPGEMFGEVALLAGDARRTEATAIDHARILVLTRDAINTTVRRHPRIAAKLFQNVATDVSRRMIHVISQLRDHRQPSAIDPTDE